MYVHRHEPHIWQSIVKTILEIQAHDLNPVLKSYILLIQQTMTTNIVVYCYTVTYDEYILKLAKYYLRYFDSQSISLIFQELSSLYSIKE